MCEVPDVTCQTTGRWVRRLAWNETAEKRKENHPKKKLFCVDVLSLDADIFYSLKCCKWRSHFSMCLHECSLHAA